MITSLKKLLSMIMAAIMVLTMFTMINAEPVYAAASPAKVTGVHVDIGGIAKEDSTKQYVVTLRWNKAKNAKKYQVYRAPSKSGKYKLVKTTSGTTFKETVKKAQHYKVRAVSGNRCGSFSNSIAAYNLKGYVKLDEVKAGMGALIVPVVINNPTNSKFYIPSMYESSATAKVLKFNIKTGKFLDEYPAYYCDSSGIAGSAVIPAKASGVLYFSAIMPYPEPFDTSRYGYTVSFMFSPGTSFKNGTKRSMAITTHEAAYGKSAYIDWNVHK